MKTKVFPENLKCEKPARERFVNWDESNVWPKVGNRSTSEAMGNAEWGRCASECRAGRGKFSIQVSFFLFCLLFPLFLRASGDSSLYPDGRQQVELRSTERNPFTQQIAPAVVPTNAQEGASEEARLRRILRAMKIGGLSGSGANRRVLLGSLILKPGAILPPILGNQFETLKVVSVDDTAVVLAFVERDYSVSARQIVLPFAIKPGVSQVMVGETFEELTKVGPSGRLSVPPLTLQGVNDLLKGSREADLRNIADRDVQMMGVTTNAENAKKDK